MEKNYRVFLKKLKSKLPYDPAIPSLGLYLKNTKTFIGKATGTLMLIAALFKKASHVHKLSIY